MNYLSRAYRYNKKIYWGIIFFSTVTLLVNFLKIETTPFFIWGMYSTKEETVDNYEILEIVVNDSVRVDYSSTFTDANRFYLLSPATYYWQILQNNKIDPEETFFEKKSGKFYNYFDPFKTSLFNDSSAQDGFLHWYAKYLEKTVHMKVVHLQLNVFRLIYNGKGQPELKNSTTLATWKQ